MSVHVTVVAKSPVPGRVKTRLCPPCTPTQAAELADAALRDTVDAVDAAFARLGVRRVLLLDGEPPGWVPGGYDVVAQRGVGLGERLSHGFDELGPGIVVGMETPHAIAALPAGLASLAAGRDVLGPALDGGYWAIGLARTDPRVFEGIVMSTCRTGADQLRRLRALGRQVDALPAARDVDTFDDVRALAASGAPGRAVRLARELVGEVDGVVRRADATARS